MPWKSRPGRFKKIAAMVNRYEAELKSLDTDQLDEQCRLIRMDLRRYGFKRRLTAHAFALIREVADRTVGKRHFDCQLIGGWIMLNGMVAEMETGEGKTLTATLAAGTAAMAGVPVHVISVNDYLTARDAEEMGPIYQALGLTVGCVVHDVEPRDRRAAYQCDITYCTNKDLVFDYLKDKITLGDRCDPARLQAESLYGGRERVNRLLLRGLHFAIVDEADSILIDEARTPLIISSSTGGEEEKQFMEQAMAIADEFENDRDFRINDAERSLKLTQKGKRGLTEKAASLGPLWTGSIRREDTVTQALTARHMFHRDIHYLVRDDTVQIIDEFTGRVMEDRSWERGLHQFIELKEGCKLTQRRDTIAKISYQRFFRRYLHLSGMTGTAKEVKRELGAVYDLAVVRVPTNRPLNRRKYPDRLFNTLEEKWNALIDQVRRLHDEGRPVLVGTRSVAVSEHVSRLLDEAGLAHQVLNAKRDREEADIIARAGESGRITIATNMAGRGTDIKLEPEVVRKNGLHVILTERHEAARIDRQLAGRCARQGDPGSYQALLSLEDPLLTEGRTGIRSWVAGRLMRMHVPGGRAAGRRAVLKAQKQMERLHARMRRELLKQDEKMGELLSFSGRQE